MYRITTSQRKQIALFCFSLPSLPLGRIVSNFPKKRTFRTFVYFQELASFSNRTFQDKMEHSSGFHITPSYYIT